MTTVGNSKGRGWAFKDEKHQSLLRRPGRTLLPDNNECSVLINELDTLIKDMKDVNINMEKIQTLFATTTDGMSSNVSKQFLDYAFGNKKFGYKLAMLASDQEFSAINWNDTNMQKIIITRLQRDYENREQILKEDVNHFRNIVDFFGSFLYYKGILSFLMASPLFVYLNMLLELGTAEDIELMAAKFTQIWATLIKDLKKKNTSIEEMDDIKSFLINVRKKVLGGNLANPSLSWLLFIIDLSCYSGNLPAYLKELHSSNLKILNSIYMIYLDDQDIPKKEHTAPRAIKGSHVNQQSN
ncbi:CBP80/20-dependent translation initiation factor-like isoform X2 [Prorops nasuta]